jgi:hypothetical protein
MEAQAARVAQLQRQLAVRAAGMSAQRATHGCTAAALT